MYRRDQYRDSRHSGAISLSMVYGSAVPATGRFRRQIGTESCLLPVQPTPSLPYLPSALAFIKITTDFTLNASLLSLIIGISKALNLNVGALLNASVLSLIVRVSKALNFNIRALLKAGDSPFKASDSFLKASKSRISSPRAPSFPSSSLLKVSRSLLKVAFPYIRYLLRLL